MNEDSQLLIDSHQHVFWHGKDDAGLVADMDAQGVSRAWLLTWEVLPFENAPGYQQAMNPVRFRADGTIEGMPLEDALAAKRRYPDRFELGFCPHPMAGDAAARFRAGVAMHGVRICGEWKFRMPFDDPRCIRLFRAAGESGAPVVLHLDVPFLPGKDGRPEYKEAWYGGTIENLERALIACPETVFIGHAPGFWREISSDADKDASPYPDGPVAAPGKLHRLLSEYPNLCADLSAGSALRALRRDPAHARKFLVEFDSKLLFGRDYYGSELLDFLGGLDLPASTREKIFHRNAEGLLARGAQPTRTP